MIPDYSDDDLRKFSPEEMDRARRLLAFLSRSQDMMAWATHHLRHRLTSYTPELPPRYGMSDFHRYAARTADELIKQRGQQRCILSPRGSAKTTWLNLAYPLREACEGREPFIIIGSDTQRKSRMFLRNIKRELERNPSLAIDYPRVVGAGSVWTADEIQLRNGVVIKSISRGENIRGLLDRTRPSLVALDDLQGPDDVASELERERAWDWLMTDLIPLGRANTNIIVLGTPVHRDAIVNRLKSTAGWQTRTFKSIGGDDEDPRLGWPERQDLWDRWEMILRDYSIADSAQAARHFYEANKAEMDKGAVIQWPEGGYDLYFLMLKLAGSGLAAFKSEYQCNPDNPDLYEWPGEYFDATKRPELFFDEWPPALSEKVLALDPSKGARSDDQGDYAAFTLFGRDQQGVEYVQADLFKGNQDATLKGIIQRAVKHVRDFQPEVFAFEDVQFQSLLAGPLRDALKAAQLEVTIWPMSDPNPKEVRIRRLTTPLMERRVRFKRTRETIILLDQLREFPTGKYDDGPDSLELARRAAIRLQRGRFDRRQGPTGFRL